MIIWFVGLAWLITGKDPSTWPGWLNAMLLFMAVAKFVVVWLNEEVTREDRTEVEHMLRNREPLSKRVLEMIRAASRLRDLLAKLYAYHQGTATLTEKEWKQLRADIEAEIADEAPSP